MLNPHSLDIDDKKKIIYLVISADNSIYKVSYPSLKILDKIYIFKNNKHDIHHLNSIKFLNNNLFVSMFSYKGVWRKNIWNDGALIKYNEKTKKKKFIKKKLYQPHSIQYFNNRFHICNSMKLEILINLKKKIQLNGYTRGLLIEKKYILVGISKIRRLKNYKNQNQYISQDAGIYYLNIARGTSNFIKFPTTEIFEIIKI